MARTRDAAKQDHRRLLVDTWIAPVLAAAAFAISGASTLLSAPAAAPSRVEHVAFAIGAAIVTGAFLVPGFPFGESTEPAELVRPAAFDWRLFALGYAVMTAALFARKLPRVPVGL